VSPTFDGELAWVEPRRRRGIRFLRRRTRRGRLRSLRAAPRRPRAPAPRRNRSRSRSRAASRAAAARRPRAAAEDEPGRSIGRASPRARRSARSRPSARRGTAPRRPRRAGPRPARPRRRRVSPASAISRRTQARSPARRPSRQRVHGVLEPRIAPSAETAGRCGPAVGRLRRELVIRSSQRASRRPIAVCLALSLIQLYQYILIMIWMNHSYTTRSRPPSKDT